MGSQIFAPEVHEIVNGITANFLATGQRMEMPSYKETVIEIAKLTQMEINAKRQKLAVPEKTASAQRKGDEDDQPPASAAPLAVAAPGAMTTKVAASVAEARAVSEAPRAAVDGSPLAGSCGPGRRQQQHLAAVKLADALCRKLDDAPTRPACFGGPLPTTEKLGEGTFATVFRSPECSSSQEAAVKVFHFRDPADAWKRDAAVAEVLAEITYVRTYVRAYVRTYAGAKPNRLAATRRRTYTHTHTRAHKHTHVRTYVRAYVRTNSHRTHTHTHTLTHTHTHTRIQHSCMHTCIHTYIHMHLRKNIH